MKGQAVTRYKQPVEEIGLDPAPLQGREALIRVTGCGVCHSDLHIQDGAFDMGKDAPKLALPESRLPLVLGHEIEGIVEALGPDASGVAVGDRVAVFPWIGCQACPTCDRGDQHLCEQGQSLGVEIHGGFATHVRVPVSDALIPCDDLPPGAGGLAMCSGLTAYSALLKLRDVPDHEPILLIGAGGVGLSALAIARHIRKGPVIVADLNPAARAAALERGAALAVDPASPDDVAALKKFGPIAAAVDFVGGTATVQFGISSVRRGGRVVIVGLFGGSFSTSLPLIPLRALSLIGSYVGSLDEARALIDLIRAGALPAPIMHDRPLDQANDALNDLRHGHVIGRTVLRPE